MQNDFGVDVQHTTQALERFSNNIRIKVTRKATRKGGKIVEARMKQLAPNKTGALIAGIRTTTKVDKSGGRAYSVVGPTGKVLTMTNGISKKRSQAFKARLVEDGTKNMDAKPFIRKSKEQTESDVLNAFTTEINKATQALR